MGQIKISFVYDPKTGKRDLMVDYESDPDRLPAEHERDHRRIVERLVGRETVQEGGTERIRPEQLPAPPEQEAELPPPQGEKEKA